MTSGITREELKSKLWEAAKRCAKRGAGYAQQAAVFEEITRELTSGPQSRLDVPLQQLLLTYWYDLFRKGDLSWGYDLSNPDPPFFHIPEETERALEKIGE